MRVIAIANQKGGVGKTATAVNLAAAIRIHDRKRVLLIDLDAQANATTWLTGSEGSPGHSIYDVIMQQAPLRDCILETPSRIDLVPSNLKTANLDVELLGVLHFHSRLAAALDYLEGGRYDYVILDCPPNLSMNTLNAFGASNVVVIPVQLKREAFDAVTHLMHTLLKVTNGKATIRPYGLPTFLSRTNLARAPATTPVLQPESPGKSTRSSIGKGPSESEGPGSFTGPAPQNPLALRAEGLLQSGAPVESAGLSTRSQQEETFSILTSLPEVGGYMPWFHQLTDYLFRLLSPAEQSIYLQLYRLTCGLDKSTCTIGYPKLSERSGMGETAARAATKGLVAKGLIRQVSMVFGLRRDQGITWEVAPPPALTKFLGAKGKRPVQSERPADSETIKDMCVVSKDTHTQTEACGGVGRSRFRLEQCRRYADHLHRTGQGITNPGGYATTIYRTGEVDTLMEAFFNPPPVEKVDLSSCPDCGGTGWKPVMKNGQHEGVKPCKHARL